MYKSGTNGIVVFSRKRAAVVVVAAAWLHSWFPLHSSRLLLIRHFYCNLGFLPFFWFLRQSLGSWSPLAILLNGPRRPLATGPLLLCTAGRTLYFRYIVFHVSTWPPLFQICPPTSIVRHTFCNILETPMKKAWPLLPLKKDANPPNY